MASSAPPPTASALSEAVVQYSGWHRGSTSPDFIPRCTGVPLGRIPRTTPPMVHFMGWPFTVPAMSPGLDLVTDVQYPG